MLEVIIVDLEGTLTDSRWRGFYSRDIHNEWHKAMLKDPPNQHIIDLLTKLGKPLVILTSKPVEYAEDMNLWLAENTEGITKLIAMQLFRPAGNFDTSPALKEKQLEIVREYYEPVFALDDRVDICAMYNRNNLPTLLVSNKLIPATLGDDDGGTSRTEICNREATEAEPRGEDWGETHS